MGTPPLAPIRTLQRPVRNRTKYLKINDSIHHLKGVAQIANPLKSFVQVVRPSRMGHVVSYKTGIILHAKNPRVIGSVQL